MRVKVWLICVVLVAMLLSALNYLYVHNNIIEPVITGLIVMVSAIFWGYLKENDK